MSIFSPSVHQKNIFDFIKNDTKNAVVSAVAGSGKTTTLLEALKIIPIDKQVLFMAFNKSIAQELKSRVPSTNNIEVKTVHGFGYSILLSHYEPKIENNKYRKLLKSITDFHTKQNLDYIREYKFDDIHMKYVHQIKSSTRGQDIDIIKFNKNVVDLCDLGRLHMIDIYSKENAYQKLEQLADIHSIEIENGQIEVCWYLILLGIYHKDEIDFTDMIFLPNVFDLSSAQYDFVFIDECQDLNVCQRLLMLKAMKPDTGRFIAVGDPKQAIYAFAGADHTSYKKLCDLPNTIQFPLSITYRCAEPIVNMVKYINPDIVHHKKNKKGEIHQEFSYANLKDGDMVLCRMTFPLVCLCIKLLNQNKKATIIGSDIGKSLVTMIEGCRRKSEDFVMSNVFSRLYNEKIKLIEKIMLQSGINKEDAEEDSKVILMGEKINVIEALSMGVEDPSIVINKITNIFSDETKTGIILSTIHKSKGLEAERVFIIHKELMPSKYAKLDWEIEQEKNLRYVAYTRAKKTLGFINDFDAWEKHVIRESEIKEPSKHVGKPNQQIYLELTIYDLRNVQTKFGDTIVYDMKDKKGNLFSKFGRIDEKFLVNSSERFVEVGSTVGFYAIIKSHTEFAGNKITQIGKISKY
jgi:DNA helicase II / ATP-dependent DNA helicase PcrA